MENGLLVDRSVFSRESTKRERRAARKVLTDHVARAVLSRDLEPFLGKVPVLSPRRIEGYEVLFPVEGLSPAIYGGKVEPIE